MPRELPRAIVPFDPVGIVAEMPTEFTGRSHIELHPDPVEMGDSSVLAPIETSVYQFLGPAELPANRSPVDAQKPDLEAKHEGRGLTIVTGVEKKEGRGIDVNSYFPQQPVPQGEQGCRKEAEEKDKSVGGLKVLLRFLPMLWPAGRPKRGSRSLRCGTPVCAWADSNCRHPL